MTSDDKPTAFDIIAARARDGLAEMTQALAMETQDRHPAVPGPDAASAIATGAVCQAVELFFGMTVTSLMPMVDGRAELDKQVDTYWRQAQSRYLDTRAAAGAQATLIGREKPE